MASVTTLIRIVNGTQDTISVRNGENSSQAFTISANKVWEGEIKVPWIGKESEDGKAIRLLVGPGGNTTMWLFQDYWNPAHQDAVKYLVAPAMSYNAETLEVSGRNRGGGSKVLTISLDGGSYVPSMT